MLQQVLISALGLGLASIIGSAIGLTVRKIPHKWNDIFMGFCAGMMLAASIVCLLVPSVEATPVSGWWQPALGVIGGVMLIGLMDKFTPHLHHLSGLDEESHINNSSLNSTLLFVLAIALHKLPEGLATGVTFNGEEGNAIAMSITIALQNIPEGMVVVTPLLMNGISFWRTTIIAIAISLLEIIGVFAGYFIGDISAIFLPFLLALAGGAMLYVISDEMIPETHSHGFQKGATYALVAGVMTMLFIEALL
ncbi:MAG: ZIP family metal transporter [Bacteroidales bacterium]|nr:ZIP family metal transporter [Bacteroidales bacterium]